MGYLLFYVFMLLIGYYAMKEFSFNYREVLELITLPIAIPMIVTVLLGRDFSFSFDLLLGLIVGIPLFLAVVVVVFYPILILPAFLVLAIKKHYVDKPMVVFFLSTLVGGAIASLVSLELEVIFTGMLLLFLSVLIQYYYFDKNRKLGVNNEK